MNKELYLKWLPDFKQRLAISDNYRDNLLIDYLYEAHKMLWDVYYELNLNTFDVDGAMHPWYSDTTTKLAVFHLAVTLYENPDENIQAQNVKDDRVVIRIIRSRMKYI